MEDRLWKVFNLDKTSVGFATDELVGTAHPTI